MRALPPRNATLPPSRTFEWRHATCWISTSQAHNDYMRRLAVAPCGTVLLVYANAAYQFLTLSNCHVRSLAGGNKRSPTLGMAPCVIDFGHAVLNSSSCAEHNAACQSPIAGHVSCPGYPPGRTFE